MASRALKRIQKDIKDIHDSTQDLKDNGVYVHVNDENMKEVYAMFVGREKTPYHHGFYFIKFTYPDDYPMSPPKAFYCTQGILQGAGQIRFNPNLYTCGKVCLSMLNTWQGPGWVPTNTIMNVFMAIQALVLNETPLHNEPGYTGLSAHDPAIQAYNRLIEYANCNIAILEMMIRPPRGFEAFLPVMEEYFVTHFQEIMTHIENLRTNSVSIKTSAYGAINITPNYDQIIVRMNEYYARFNKKVDSSLAVVENIFKFSETENVSVKPSTSTSQSGADAAAGASLATKILNDEELANMLAISQILDEDDQEN
jgi:ubiquitin-protein ligase